MPAMEIPTNRIASWDDVIDRIDDLDRRGPFAGIQGFRGQADESWKLKPTLDRVLSEKLSFDQMCRIEMQAIRVFQSHAANYFRDYKIPFGPDHIAAWWMLMQHYSAPTRLLDWTRSPYVALYFAAIQEPNKDGAVWYLCDAAVSQAFNETLGKRTRDDVSENFGKHYFDEAADDRVEFWQSTEEIIRITAQEGWFSVGNRPNSDHGRLIASVLNEVGRLNASFFCKWIIPSQLKPLMVSKLIEKNITTRSLFPGEDGLGRSIREVITVESAVLSGILDGNAM